MLFHLLLTCPAGINAVSQYIILMVQPGQYTLCHTHRGRITCLGPQQIFEFRLLESGYKWALYFLQFILKYHSSTHKWKFWRMKNKIQSYCHLEVLNMIIIHHLPYIKTILSQPNYYATSKYQLTRIISNSNPEFGTLRHGRLTINSSI